MKKQQSDWDKEKARLAFSREWETHDAGTKVMERIKRCMDIKVLSVTHDKNMSWQLLTCQLIPAFQ